MAEEKKPRPVKNPPSDNVDAAVEITSNAGPVLTVKLKDFIDRVVTASGGKRQSVKPVVEAVLKVLGDALEAGENLALPPLGRARVNRSKTTDSGALLTIKLKRGGAAKTPKSGGDEGLAEAGE